MAMFFGLLMVSIIRNLSQDTGTILKNNKKLRQINIVRIGVKIGVQNFFRRKNMPEERTRKIVIAGIMSAIAIFLGVTRLGFITWFSGASLTIMHVPVIIGAVLEGPVVGLVIGLIFGVSSMIQAAVAPGGPADALFTNPLISVLPRLFIGPVAWLVWKSLKNISAVGLVVAGALGSLTNTILVLTMIAMVANFPPAQLLPIVVANGLPEAVGSALIVLVVVGAWLRIRIGRKQGANL